MHIPKLVSYIGHSSTSESLDEFLHENGIKKRPKGEPPVRITDFSKKITLAFEESSTYKEENDFPVVGDGWFVLRSVYVERGALGALPFGLSFEVNRTEIPKIIGNPVNVSKDEIDTFYVPNFLVIIWYKNNKNSINAIRFLRPDFRAKKAYGLN